MPLFAALLLPYCLLPCSVNPVELRLYGVFFFCPDFLNPDRLRLVGVFFGSAFRVRWDRLCYREPITSHCVIVL